MSQSSYFKSRPDLLTLGGVGGGNRKSWKTLINVVDVIDVTGLDPLSLGVRWLGSVLWRVWCFWTC